MTYNNPEVVGNNKSVHGAQVPPLGITHPFAAAYLVEFDASRWPHEPDTSTDLGMRLALAGTRNVIARTKAAA